MNDGNAGPTDWSQFYQNMASDHRNPPLQSFADTSAAASGPSRNKPARKRSRTSRRAPTTLLNTDPSNFRAMVQQFTGVPSVPYANSYMTGGATDLNFGIGFNSPVHDRYDQLVQENQYRGSAQEMIGLGVGGNMENRREVGLGLPEEFFLDGIGGQVDPRRPSEDNGGGGGYFF